MCAVYVLSRVAFCQLFIKRILYCIVLEGLATRGTGRVEGREGPQERSCGGAARSLNTALSKSIFWCKHAAVGPGFIAPPSKLIRLSLRWLLLTDIPCV